MPKWLGRLWTGAKIGIKVAAAINGKKIGKGRIDVREVPQILDIITGVDAIIQAAKKDDSK